VRIANNISLINAYGNMKKVNNKLQKSCERLASGYRINCSADDAAGLAISEKMRAQINGLSQASNNISDGINYVQVADGALQEVQNIFLRIRELSVKASNDVYQGEDRQAIEEEIKQLKQEASNIFNGTEFNGIKVWDQYTDVQIGVKKVTAVTANVINADYSLDNNNKGSVPADGSYLLKADENGIVVSWKAYNGNEYNSDTISWPAGITGKNHGFRLSEHLDLLNNPELKGIDFTYSYNVNKFAELQDVIASINGARVYSSTHNSVGTKVFTDDGNSINGVSFSASIYYEALLASNKNFEEYDTAFIENSVSKIVNENNLIQDPIVSDSSLKWQFEFEMPNIGTVKAESYSTDYRCYWKDPNKKWWDVYESNGKIEEYKKVYSPVPDGADLDSVIYSLNNDAGVSLLKDTNETGGYIFVNFNLTSESDYKINPGDSSSYKSVGNITMKIAVGASDTVDTIKDKLSNIKGLDIFAGNESTNSPSNTYTRISGQTLNDIKVDSPVYEKKDIIKLDIQAGANKGEIISIDYDSLSNNKLGISDISVLTRHDANNAISAIDAASEGISSQRSIFGALHNRMEHAKSNVDNSYINITDSEGQIRDADMAKEMAGYVKEQILMQANQSIMPQIKIMYESVLELLK